MVFNRYKDIDVMKCYTKDDVAVSLLSFVIHTNTLILLILTQSHFGARFFLLQMNTFFGKYVYVHQFLMRHWTLQ